MSWPRIGSSSPNGCACWNISQACHWLDAQSPNSTATTPASGGRQPAAAARRSSEIEIGPSRVTSTQSRGASVRSAIRTLANSTTNARPIAAAPELALRGQRADEDLAIAGFAEPQPVGIERHGSRQDDHGQQERGGEEYPAWKPHRPDLARKTATRLNWARETGILIHALLAGLRRRPGCRRCGRGGPASRPDGGLAPVLARISARVEQFYSRARTVTSRETVLFQQLESDFRPMGFARRLVYELRWPGIPRPTALRRSKRRSSGS